MSTTPNAAAVTRTARKVTARRFTSWTVTPGVVRSSLRVEPGDSMDEVRRLARLVAAELMQRGGFDASVDEHGTLTVAEPEPTVDEPSEDDSPCGEYVCPRCGVQDGEHADGCAVTPIAAGDVFVAGDRVSHTNGDTGVVVVGTHRDDVHVDDLWVTVAWDGEDGTERHHPSTLTRIASPVRCSGCDAPVVVTVDERGATTHCGGDGDGVCDAIVDGDPAATQSHEHAVAQAGR